MRHLYGHYVSDAHAGPTRQRLCRFGRGGEAMEVRVQAQESHQWVLKGQEHRKQEARVDARQVACFFCTIQCLFASPSHALQVVSQRTMHARRITNTINTASGGILLRPTVINCFEGELNSLEQWWDQWRKFMFQTQVEVVADKKHPGPQTVVKLLEPILHKKYPAVSVERENFHACVTATLIFAWCSCCVAGRLSYPHSACCARMHVGACVRACWCSESHFSFSFSHMHGV
jgi:hypothetical protein